jgi:hypothetical protein
VPREEAERRRGFDPEVPPTDRAKNRSLFFYDLLDIKVREFNPRYADAVGALLGRLGICTLTSTATGVRSFIKRFISSCIAINEVYKRYIAIYCDLTKRDY